MLDELRAQIGDTLDLVRTEGLFGRSAFDPEVAAAIEAYRALPLRASQEELVREMLALAAGARSEEHIATYLRRVRRFPPSAASQPQARPAATEEICRTDWAMPTLATHTAPLPRPQPR